MSPAPWSEGEFEAGSAGEPQAPTVVIPGTSPLPTAGRGPSILPLPLQQDWSENAQELVFAGEQSECWGHRVPLKPTEDGPRSTRLLLLRKAPSELLGCLTAPWRVQGTVPASLLWLLLTPHFLPTMFPAPQTVLGPLYRLGHFFPLVFLVSVLGSPASLPLSPGKTAWIPHWVFIHTLFVPF